MKKQKKLKIGTIFVILLFCLVSFSITYAGYTARLNIFGTVETWDPSGNCSSHGFWKTEFKYYLTGQGSPHVTEQQLIDYCAAVFELYNDEVFGSLDPAVGDSGLSFQEAYDILSSTSPEMKDHLRLQLLAAELNAVSDDYQADDNQLFLLFIHQAEDCLVSEQSELYEYYKDLMDSYNNCGEE